MTKPALLLLHGFGGGRIELAPLEKLLCRQGYCCHSITLPGHDSKGVIAPHIRHHDFQMGARKAYLELKKQHEHIAVIGFSMGGLLAINLAAEFTPVAIATINTPVLFWSPRAMAHWLRDDIQQRRPFHLHRLSSAIRRQKLRMNLEYPRLLFKTLPLMEQVRCPVLIAQSVFDDTSQMRSADMLKQLMRHANATVRYYDKSWHTICHSDDLGKLHRDIAAFLDGIEKILVPLTE